MATEVHSGCLSHVQHDPAHCLAAGLFLSCSKRDQSRRKLDVSHRRDGYTVRFLGFEPLGADDLRFLQCIVAFAGRDGIMLTPRANQDVPMFLRDSLLTCPDARKSDALMVTFKGRVLLEELNMTVGGTNLRNLKESLIRMSNVSVVLTGDAVRGGATTSFHLLSFFVKGSTCEVSVALNPYLADAILGNRSHTRIDLSEIRQLDSDVARLIHQRLCGFVNPGATVSVGGDVMAQYAWGSEKVSDATNRKRRQRLLLALDQLRGIGWKVEEYRRQFFRVSRPKANSYSVPD